MSDDFKILLTSIEEYCSKQSPEYLEKSIELLSKYSSDELMANFGASHEDFLSILVTKRPYPIKYFRKYNEDNHGR